MQEVVKILEISGIVIGASLGTILLNRQVVGQAADCLLSAKQYLFNRLTSINVAALMPMAITQIKTDRKELNTLIDVVVSSIIAFTMIVASIIGKLLEVSWLFGFGIIVVGSIALATIIDTVIRCRRSRKRYLLLSLFPFLLVGRIFSGFVVAPIIIVLTAFLILLLVLLEKLFNLIAGRT